METDENVSLINPEWPSSNDGVPAYYLTEKPMFPDAKYRCVEFFTEVAPNIYRCAFEVENFPFAKQLIWHCIVEPGKRALFIDCGWWELCGVRMLDEVVNRFNIPWENIEIFITHFHKDHDGNLAYCIKNGVKRVFHGPTAVYEERRVHDFLVAVGSAKNNDFDYLALVELFHGKNVATTHKAFNEIAKGTEKRFSIAGYNLDTVFTPGHTADHICLVDREKGILFAGDHITDSAPGVLKVDNETSALAEYLDSLEEFKKDNLNIIYMSHAAPLVGTEIINEFLERMIRKCDKPLQKTYDILAAQSEPINMHDFSVIAEAHRPGGFLNQRPDVRGRRIMYNYGFVDYLCLQGKATYEVDQDGVRVYSLIKSE